VILTDWDLHQHTSSRPRDACTAASGALYLSVFPVFPTASLVALRDPTPYRLGLVANSDSFASFATGIVGAGEPEPGFGPPGQAAGRAVRMSGTGFVVSDRRCKERERGDTAQHAGTI